MAGVGIGVCPDGVQRDPERAPRPANCSASNCGLALRRRPPTNLPPKEKLKLSERPTNTLAPRASNVVLQPARWPQPKGYANGIKARGEMRSRLVCKAPSSLITR